MSFPVERPRRLRRGEIMRSLVRETDHAPQRFVLPYFVREGDGGPQPIASMPGHFRLTVDQVLGEAEKALEDGVKSVLLFGIPEEKDAQGRGAWIEELSIPNYPNVVNNPRTKLQGINTRTYIYNMQICINYLKNLK